jgi:subtilisin family serine protease
MRSSARRAEPPAGYDLTAPVDRPVRVTVLDTGFVGGAFVPQYGDGNPYTFEVDADPNNSDVPDTADTDQRVDLTPTAPGNGILDPAAGHGTFIAGVIRQLTDTCAISVKRVLTTFGVGDEARIARKLSELRSGDDRLTDFVNLSFGGYSPYGMRPLAETIEQLSEVQIVVVASAGNDATCLPMYPAAIPGVIGVAAVDKHDSPASFTNYGPWVRACTLGVDVVSTFFHWNGSETGNPDPDDFQGWAKWSGTSFAAPRVVAALAEEYARRKDDSGDAVPYDAVKALIDDRQHARLPMLGTLVLPS